jgi:uncharacterized protein YqeY
VALKEQLQSDLKAALLSRDSGNRFVSDTLRDLKAAILNEEVAKGKREEGLSDTEIEQVIAREVKKRRESIVLYEQNGRGELADSEKKELEVLEEYLPAQLSEAEVTAAVQDAIAQLGASSPQMMGQVIGAVKAKVGNTADGAVIARIVKEQLTT